MRKNLIKTIATGAMLVGLGATLAQAAAPPTPQGYITEKIFVNIGGGTAVTDLTSNAKFINNTPDILAYNKYFEMYAGDDINTPPPGDVRNNSGCQIIGYFYPPTSGDYTFWIAADDNADLYLSTDDTAANKKLIAHEDGYSGARDYTVGGGAPTTVTNKSSMTYGATQWPVKDPSNGGAKITLQAGKAYYIEALEKEGGGGEDLSVSIDATLPIDGSMLSTFDVVNGNLSITTQPVGATVNEGTNVAFKVVLNGTPPFTYQWKKDGVDIQDATNFIYNISRAYRADAGTYTVAVTGGAGPALTSTGAVLAINNDTVAPTITGTSTTATFDSVIVTFSEPVDPETGTNTANYVLTNPSINVLGATLGQPAGTPGDNVVILTTAKMPGTTLLTLKVTGVKDVPGNVIAANTTIGVQTFVFSLGWATYNRWDNDTTSLTDFATAVNGGTKSPANVNTAITQFDGPWGVADNYNEKKYTWFTAPFSGDYVFFDCSDDNSYLYLSTDETAANKKLIAQENNWSNQNQWIASGGGSVLTDKRSDSFASSEWPTPNVITLVQGKKYYMEILHHEGGGGDGCGATFIKSGAADPSGATALVGNVIGTYLDPTGAHVTINTQPANTTAVEDKTATLTVAATGTSLYGSTVGYQWQKAPSGSSLFTDIAGATLSSYKTPTLTLANNGDQYRVICSVPTVSTTSDTATLTVIPDTVPPVVVGATAFPGSTKVGLTFDEALDPVTANTPANYKVNGVVVLGVQVRTNVSNEKSNEQNLVQLTVATALSADFTVTVNGVKDLHNNPVANATTPGAIIKLTPQDVGTPASAVGGPDPVFPGTVTTWGPGNYDVNCGGSDYYNNADGFNYVWEKKTNSFDVKVRCVSITPVSQWSAVGLIVRDSLSGYGREYHEKVVTRGDETTADSGNVATGSNDYELNSRPARGDETLGNTSNSGPGATRGWTGTAVGSMGPPNYPDAWVRIAREKSGTSDHLKGYGSNDGKTWTLIHDVDLNDAAHAGYLGVDGLAAGPWPDVCYVGMGTTAHNNGTDPASGLPWNVWGIYREYGDMPATGGTPTVSAVSDPATGKITITYTGTLVSSDTAGGTYAPVAGATSPYTVDPKASGAKVLQFYKAQQ